MIALTSISPSHKNKEFQQDAIKSWKDQGFKVYSFNCKEEIELLKDYDINFIEVEEHGKDLYGKPYVYLNSFIDFIKENGSALILNSDIILKKGIVKVIESTLEDVLVLSRYDDNGIELKRFKDGYDAFYISKELAHKLPVSQLVMGQCHWDYWLPISSMRAGYKIVTSKSILAVHKKHPLQYDHASWTKTALIFGKELDLNGTVSSNSRWGWHKIESNMNVVW